MLEDVFVPSTATGSPSKPWSKRNGSSVPCHPIVALASACQRPLHYADGALRTDVIEETHCERLGAERPASRPGLLVEPLSPREVQVLRAICDGDSNKDISRKLEIGVPTVKYHVLQIFGKLGAQRRTQAVGIAIHLGLVQPDWLPATKRIDRSFLGNDRFRDDA